MICSPDTSQVYERYCCVASGRHQQETQEGFWGRGTGGHRLAGRTSPTSAL